MEKMQLHDIREKFLTFFESRGHLRHPSYSLIPKNDKSLLLIGAGMAPLKKYFTKEEEPPASRMTTCQKCVRTGDIDNVGKTQRHLTFFEMLGNFSFGDYFKHEAIQWAWEFLTEVMHLPKERLWVSVYLEDDDAYAIWRDEIGVPEERIVRLGKEDNFWELEVGPSGPCTEIHYDKGPAYGCGCPDCKPGCDCDRYLEVWNLVFTQFDKDEKGIYHPLANPNIDTGMGLERLACVMEGVDSVYDIGAIRSIMNVASEISGKAYGNMEADDVHLRIIADHTRAMTFLVSDGVVPSNEGRGYVLRKLIRRAARHGMLLGIEDAFLEKTVREVIRSWGHAYPELEEHRDVILEVIDTEEARFKRTIRQGIELLNRKIESMREEGNTVLGGDDVFLLYDTYGFPPELTEEILRESGYTYDARGFSEAMETQKERARSALDTSDSGWKKEGDQADYSGFDNTFSGYTTLEGVGKIRAIFSGDHTVDIAREGESVVLVLDETPFYGEGGGQVGDRGVIATAGGRAAISDTKKTKSGLMLHMATVEEGVIRSGEAAKTAVDRQRRADIRRNHSATHLLHAALRQVLGTHVHQAGSLVAPDRLRFDFSHYMAMRPEEIKAVERIVNEKILEAIPVVTEIKSLDEAKREGVMGLFEAKYGEVVRVLKMGPFSMELCGGTHVSNTSEIGLFKIVMESGIAAGIRRIEAITGRAAYDWVCSEEMLLEDLTGELKAKRETLVARAREMQAELRESKREVQTLREALSGDKAKRLEEAIRDMGDYRLLAASFEGLTVDELKSMADDLRNRHDDLMVIFGTKTDGKGNLLVALSKALVERGKNAGAIVRSLAKALGGNGGGKPDLAMAGAKDLSRWEDIFRDVDAYIS